MVYIGVAPAVIGTNPVVKAVLFTVVISTGTALLKSPVPPTYPISTGTKLPANGVFLTVVTSIGNALLKRPAPSTLTISTGINELSKWIPLVYAILTS